MPEMNRDVHAHFTSLSSAQLALSQVVLLVKLVLLMSATNSVSERSASTMRRIKTYLRSTMTRLNNTMVLHIHNHLTDNIDHTSVLKLMSLRQLTMKEGNFLEPFHNFYVYIPSLLSLLYELLNFCYAVSY